MSIEEAKSTVKSFSFTKVKHSYFTKGEYIYFDGEVLRDEQNNDLSEVEEEYWSIRKNWPKTWEILY